MQTKFDDLEKVVCSHCGRTVDQAQAVFSEFLDAWFCHSCSIEIVNDWPFQDISFGGRPLAKRKYAGGARS
jgi:hypothetical protein